MNSLYRDELLKLGLLLSLGYLIGSQWDYAWAGLAIALCFYILMMLRYYRHFNDWLDNRGLSKKPLVNTFWSTIIDQIQRLLNELRNEQQLLREDVEYFKESFQALDNGVVVIDHAGKIDWCNKSTLDLLGIQLERDKGELLVNLIRAPEFNRYLEQQQFDQPLILVSPRSPQLHLEIQATIFRHNHTLVFARDISDVYILEKMRRDFVANVSHELRTPLTVITGYLETLKDNIEGLPDIWPRAIEQMLVQSHRMDTMVEDLIALSRLESVPKSQSHTDRVTIEGLLTGLVSDAKLPFPKKSISLDIATDTFQHQTPPLKWPLQMIGNYDELHSALSNLIQNAIKYTSDSGKIQISCKCVRNNMLIEVQDDGEGIDAIHIPRLTERFYRVDSSRTSSTGGTGLGLAIVKHVLARHNAELTIHSVVGKGSRFICTFPLEVLESEQPTDN